MIKRYCDCCKEEVDQGKNPIENATNGMKSVEATVDVGESKVLVSISAIIPSKGCGTDICKKCAISAVRKVCKGFEDGTFKQKSND